jgi:proline iminopeptidase
VLILRERAVLDRRNVLLSGGAAGLLAAAKAAPNIQEGKAQVPGGKVWWRKVGAAPRTPLLTLHGGPGTGHDYLTPLEALADQRPVILYDQLGCGRSDAPDDNSLYHIERFCDEIDALRRDLSLTRVILYGHSWGGWLAQEYMARRGDQAGVEALILASTSASTAQFVAGARRLLAAMPDQIGEKIAALEAAGKTETPEYGALVQKFYDQHLIHLKTPAAYMAASGHNLESSKTYPFMNGPSEFYITGNLKGWDRSADLGRIKVPTLVLTSTWDEVTLDCSETLHRGIPGSELAVIPDARHLSMVEKPREYVAVLRQFLASKA